MANFKEIIANVEAFVFDVDGVFTEGGITPVGNDEFHRTYYAKDGYAFAYAAKMGYKMFIISAGRGNLLRERFEHLAATEIHTICLDKVTVLKNIISRYNLNPANVVYMGDDIPDLECMRSVGIPVCPSDAASEIIDASIYVSEFAGGKGCVRDIIEQTLRAQDKWAKSLKAIHIAASPDK